MNILEIGMLVTGAATIIFGLAIVATRIMYLATFLKES